VLSEGGAATRLLAWRGLFPSLAAAVVGFHAVLLFGAEGLQGGGDLLPHLRLVELMRLDPAIRSPYPPAFHVLGALLAPFCGLVIYTKLFMVAAVACQIAAFRRFQRAAGLPDASALLFTLWPYSFTQSWTVRIELAGYALVFLALALLLRRRYVSLALVTAASFWVHTAAAVLLGLSAGVLALARRDGRALGALALGSLGFLPLLASHLGAGCTLQQALLLSPGDLWHPNQPLATLAKWPLIVTLASPPVLVAALVGAPRLWKQHRDVSWLCLALLFLYLQELWLAPFGASTTSTLMRSLSFLVLPVCAAAGSGLAAQPARVALPWLVAAGVWCGAAATTVAREALAWRAVGLEEIRDLRPLRCSFAFSAPNRRRTGGPGPAPEWHGIHPERRR